MNRHRPTRKRLRRERGVLLGVVLILMVVVLLGGALAMWGVRTDTASSGADRLQRQLFACAEQGAEWGKQFFSTTDWAPYLAANNVCTHFPCGPFKAGGSAPPTGYPDLPPYRNSVTMGGGTITANGKTFATAGQTLTYTVGIYNPDLTNPSPNMIAVYSRCVDSVTKQSKAVQLVLRTQVPSNIDYAGQVGFGFRNQGNQN